MLCSWWVVFLAVLLVASVPGGVPGGAKRVENITAAKKLHSTDEWSRVQEGNEGVTQRKELRQTETARQDMRLLTPRHGGRRRLAVEKFFHLQRQLRARAVS